MPFHLSRIFRKHYGCTMAEFVNRLRVQFVCGALSRDCTDLAIDASDAGFADQNHLGRIFKSCTARLQRSSAPFSTLSPTQYHRDTSPIDIGLAAVFLGSSTDHALPLATRRSQAMFVLFYTFSNKRAMLAATSGGGTTMPRSIYLAALFSVLAIFVIDKSPHVAAAGSPKPTGKAGFTPDGKLVRPADYRKWVFLSSGYGMSYAQKASDDPDHQMFTNVFVPPADYDYFLEHGTWPDKTMFVLEMYGSQSKGSINQRGNFQTEFMGLDVEVKDASRFPDKWAYFGFNGNENASSAISPGKNDCWKCHDQNAAVEHSFVQFYPTLLSVAKEKKTIKDGVKLP